jgi:hypothetical protein
MSVVDGRNWNGLKKFNLNELYKLAPSTIDAANGNNKSSTGNTPGEAKDSTN